MFFRFNLYFVCFFNLYSRLQDSEDALLPLVFASASGTSDTFEATIPPQMASGWGDWGDFLAYISWPSPTLPAQAETKRHSGSLWFHATHLVVDYAFDP